MSGETSGWGDYNLSYLAYGKIPNISYQTSSSNLIVTIKPQLRIYHTGYADERGTQVNLMNQFGKVGDKFIIYDAKLSTGYAHKLIPTLKFGKTNNDNDFILVNNSSGSANYPYGSCWEFQDAKGNKLFPKDITGYPESINIGTSNKEFFRSLATVSALSGGKTGIYSIYNISNPIEIDTGVNPSNITVTIDARDGKKIYTANDYVKPLPQFVFGQTDYPFNDIVINGSKLQFVNNKAEIEINFQAYANNNRYLGSERFIIPVTRKVETDTALTLYHDDNGAQYMQWGVYRVRLNTLFARQLVSRATTGIDTILSMETQNIQEPQLGKGFYAAFKIPPYNPSIHGDKCWFKHVVVGSNSTSNTL
ncbi:hypothetical protein HZS38_00765 [Xenorhabdus nematophila]|uniref:hypothetical protein n=1 Tax=Xenorhabdus nematophila TaxID=628 RepID=UPI0005441B9E|nr:hypothetical protein [Xenorhabdus nematophila]MCB4425012.1 hypothetical protein [Xenorhabdus nematophila]QNJ36885.1 hypothetical protein H8F46_00930 [Xenorhabdus nematophila]CEF31087.1 hypothetical protein XNW1_3080053 [Xenorhabdus nematophila str. Websteri]